MYCCFMHTIGYSSLAVPIISVFFNHDPHIHFIFCLEFIYDIMVCLNNSASHMYLWPHLYLWSHQEWRSWRLQIWWTFQHLGETPKASIQLPLCLPGYGYGMECFSSFLPKLFTNFTRCDALQWIKVVPRERKGMVNCV